MECVHPDGMARRLDVRAGPRTCRLEDAQLCLQLGGMTAERVERIAHALRIEPLADPRQVLVPR
jgi:hypothetical protein